MIVISKNKIYKKKIFWIIYKYLASEVVELWVKMWWYKDENYKQKLKGELTI